MMNTLQDFSIIKLVVDKYFDLLEEKGGNFYMSEFIPEVMLDRSKEYDEGYSYWLPVKSTVSEKDVIDMEVFLGHPLPESFIFFLRQRHFMELQLGSHAINFFSILPGEVLSKFKEIIEMLYWNLLERNYLPFAHVSDWGVLCFDANLKSPTNDYSVIILDHEDGYNKPTFYARSFKDMFNEFNALD
ncbi:SMI1/KNR4 family protein [Chitinophaga sp. YIM B06452]|uniref:SMI1/KNR4 family protein n=1 Tax=Chitinophaga sp. YIM B06452 TaxID=3082158 RepID=UPI0031FE5AF3